MSPKPKKQKIDAKKFDPDKLAEFIEEAKTSHPEATPILNKIVEGSAQEGGIAAWVGSFVATDDKAANHALELYGLLPPEDRTTYTTGGFTDGIAKLHMFQCGVDPADGFSLGNDDDVLTMISIILGCGEFKTDPAIPGVDAIAIRPSTSELGKKNIQLVINNGPVSNTGISNVAYIKGKKRLLAGRAIAAAVIALGRPTDFASMWPSLWQSMRTVYASIKGPFDHLNDFIRSMQIAVVSSVTRQRPNIMQWVQHAEKESLDEAGVDALMNNFDSGSKGGLASKLSKKERLAIKNIIVGMSLAARRRLLEYVCHKGMTRKTAFSLDGLCAQTWRTGWQHQSASSKWKALLQTSDEATGMFLRSKTTSISLF